MSRCSTSFPDGFNTDWVLQTLRVVKPYRSPGQDPVILMILKELAPVAVLNLTELFTQSLTLASLPAEWKPTVICALFNVGAQSDSVNR